MALWNFWRPKPRHLTVSTPGATAAWGAPGVGARDWMGARPSRLLTDLPGAFAPAINRELIQQLSTLRNRSRWLAQNNGYTRGYLAALRRNVAGPQGFRLQMDVKSDAGVVDADANERIEAAWDDWSSACEVTGRMTFPDLLRAVIVGVARDGEAIVRKVRGGDFNRHGFALQLLDPSMLDETVNGRPGDGTIGVAEGNIVRAGVEIDAWDRPRAYWLRGSAPNDDPTRADARRLFRVPADQILHLFVTEWPNQVRGVPWLSASLRTLAMLDGYSEAELVAARVSAGKMGFYRQSEAEEVDEETAADAKLVREARAGHFELLPKGVEFQTFDPQHPAQAFGAFVAAQQRQAAAGAQISYAAFANDPATLNYSALRHVALEDRDEYRTLQNWLIGALPMRFFSDWLRETLISGVTGLSDGDFRRLNSPKFRARGWQWVDPKKEVDAIREEIALGLNSRTRAAAQRGEDLVEIVADLRKEESLMAGISSEPEPPTPPPAGDPGV